MPFDGRNHTTPDLTVPSLEALSYALRHREVWPEGFRWNYDHCYGCAIGLAARLLNQNAIALATPSGMARLFGCSTLAARDIFWRLSVILGFSNDHNLYRGRITPEHVASAIDDYLASR
jgi:hypothetical protein